MKQFILSVLVLGFLTTIQAQDASEGILGTWFNEARTSKFEMYKVGSSFSAKIIWISDSESSHKDKNNPDPNLRDRDILEIDIITGLNFDAGKWVNGRIYAPKKGMYAKCKVELMPNGSLKVTGTKSGFSKSEVWTRQ